MSRFDAADAALADERNRRRWAETRASHWRREWYLTMDTLGVRSNELGRAHMAHRTALAQERQAREQAEIQAEIQAEEWELSSHRNRESLAACEIVLADERARGERLAAAQTWMREAFEKIERWAEQGSRTGQRSYALHHIATSAKGALIALDRLAAPASPAVEPDPVKTQYNQPPEPGLTRYWVSWWTKQGCIPNPPPLLWHCWESGQGEQGSCLVALIDAPDETALWGKIRTYWPDAQPRFVQLACNKTLDSIAASGRFT